MNPKRPQPRSNRSAVLPLVLVAFIVLTPVLYVLSVGPLLWCCANGVISESTVEMLGGNVYAPYVWVRDRSPAFDNAEEIYLGWWLPPERKP